MEELDWDGGAGLGRRAGLRVEELDWGWRSWTRDGRCFLCPRAPLPPLSVWGSTVVLVFNIGIFYVIFATYLHFKVIRYLKFRWVFKWHFHSSAWVPPLVSDAAKDRKIGERKARAQQGKRAVRRRGSGCYRKPACMGQDLEGP